MNSKAMNTRQLTIAGMALLLCFTTTANAATPPFTEGFDADAANWLNITSTALLDYTPTGGADGGGFVSDSFNFVNANVGDQGPVIFRGTTSVLGAASDGEFFGNWLDDGVGGISASVRHNAPVPLFFFTRLASPFNFPGATAIHFTPILPNTWSKISTDTNHSSFVTFEGASYFDVFDGIGNVQFGVSIPAALAGVDQEFTFDLDQVSISEIPEPATAGIAMLACCGLVLAVARQRTLGTERKMAA